MSIVVRVGFKRVEQKNKYELSLKTNDFSILLKVVPDENFSPRGEKSH